MQAFFCLQSYSYSADAGKVLDLVIHSLYKHKDVFLRELISNASDSLNKLRQESILNQDLLAEDAELKIQCLLSLSLASTSAFFSSVSWILKTAARLCDSKRVTNHTKKFLLCFNFNSDKLIHL